MADLRGREQGFKDVALIVKVPAKGIAYDKETGEEKGRYIEVQMDQSNLSASKVKKGEVKGQTAPYLVNERTSFVDKDTGETVEYTKHDAFCHSNQLDKIIEGANGNMFETENGDKYYAVKATLMRPTHGSGLIINTKQPILESETKMSAKILDKQVKITTAAREFRSKELAANAKEVEAAKEVEHGVEAEAQPEM